MRLLSKDFNFLVLVAVSLLLLVILPALNAWAPEGSALHFSNFHLNLWGKYLCYAVLAISVNLLWGYTGLLSLGQALFFALGGYAFGMYLMLMIGELGSYKSPLPDFMVFLGYQELPAHWKPFYSFWFAAGAAIIVPALLALVFGFLIFRARIRGVYFAIVTQALTYAATLLFFRNEFTFGGNNGFTDFKLILGHDIRSPDTQRVLFMLTGAWLCACLAFTWLLGKTKFGKVQKAIRDGENRVRFSGYDTTSYKLFVFVASAVILGVAGALYVLQVGIINPEEMRPSKSLEAVVWVAVGGRATLLGPIIGAISINWLKSYTTYHFPDYWLIILGTLFVLVVLFMPQGIAGAISQGWSRLRKRAEATPATGKQLPEAATSKDAPEQLTEARS